MQILQISEKYRLLRDVENGIQKKRVAEKYGIPSNTLSTILKNKESIITAVGGGLARGLVDKKESKNANFNNAGQIYKGSKCSYFQ